MSDYRYNPLTGQFVPETVTDEEHTIEFWADINDYGIKVRNGIQLTNPRTVTVVENNTGAAVFTEQTARVAPNAGQFWVDYDAATFTGTSWILFNSADNGKNVLVSYKSLGRIARYAHVFEDVLEYLSENPFTVGGDLTIGAGFDLKMSGSGRIEHGGTPVAGFLDDGTPFFQRLLTGTFPVNDGSLLLPHGLGDVGGESRLISFGAVIYAASSTSVAWTVSHLGTSNNQAPDFAKIDAINVTVTRGAVGSTPNAQAWVYYLL